MFLPFLDKGLIFWGVTLSSMFSVTVLEVDLSNVSTLNVNYLEKFL